MAQLSIVYFAWVRERIGLDGEAIAHPGQRVTVADLIETLSVRGDPYADALSDPSRLRAAIDQNFVPLDTSLGDAREVAIFPPVTGG